MNAPATTIAPSREQLLYWLHEAAEIEHNLMCCYLYAAFSLKQADARWSAEQAAAVASWRRLIVSVALEEMSHLCLVGNLVSALGATPHFNRPMFPIESGPYPAGFVMRLQPFSPATIEHFKFLERPQSMALDDASEFAPTATYRRTFSPDRLSPGARDYVTVGELYAALRGGLDAYARECGEAALFIGDAALQVDASLAPLPGVSAITDLASAHRALDTIVTQGEGAGGEQHDSHFCRFMRLGEELGAHLAADPAFEPAWPAATNPVMNPPPTPGGKVHISHPEIARWLDIGNAFYTTSLRCLLQGFASAQRAEKGRWLAASFALMRAMVPVGQGLAARPASVEPDSCNAGLTFTSLRTLALLPNATAREFVAARLHELLARAQALPVVLVEGETAAGWQLVLDTLAAQHARIEDRPAGTAAPAATPAAVAKPAPARAAPAPATQAASPAIQPASTATQPPAVAPVEVARGKDITIHFESRRCIHSRHCVLDAPQVFRANTPGEWIFPDRMPVAVLVAVAENCPSGAIAYERHDGGPAEKPPEVNTLRIRENGPYAVHAPMHLAGQDDGFRATLCRCGQSQRKPWCDGSHAAAGFTASGEPASGDVQALAVRGGVLQVDPLRNGPLHVNGNLEICAGTGRTVARVTDARLCRCGQSQNKPFCDLSHVAAGFQAEGA